MKGTGVVTIDEIGVILKKNGVGDFVLVLDCCHAGAAKTVTRSNSPYFLANISLLGSGDISHRAAQSVQASPFTEALTAAVLWLSRAGEIVSLSAVHARIIESGYKNAFLTLREGQTDIVLHRPERNQDSRFPDLFYGALARANSSERSALWYMLADNTQAIILSVLTDPRLLGENEPIWLGRRAIGSCIDALGAGVRPKLELCSRLMDASSWSSNCVGLIGGRGELADIGIRDRFDRILRTGRTMDARWLALLYLGDVGLLNVDLLPILLTTTGFGKSRWGRTELARTAAACAKLFDPLCDLLQNADPSPSQQMSLDLLRRHAGFGDERYSLLRGIEGQNSFLRRIIELPQRARTGLVGGSKWFTSQLKGNYRWQSQYSIDEFLEEHGTAAVQAIAEGLLAIDYIPLILSFLESCRRQTRPELLDVAPFLKHSHPWVRREAIQVAVRQPTTDRVGRIVDATKLPVDSAVYPGLIDLLVVAYGALAALGSSDAWIDALSAHNLSPGDERLIESARVRERMFGSI